MTDHLDRTDKFTDSEFGKLARHAGGDIVDLSTAFIWITGSQRELLTEDDCSRMEDYEEEVRCMMADAVAEFS